MLFQGGLLPALALIITPWVANDEILGGIVATYVAGLWMLCITRSGQIKVWHVALNGILYVAYLAMMLKH